MNGIFFTPGIFCYNYFGVFGKPQGLCVYFVTGHLTEFSLQLEGLFALWFSLNVLFLCRSVAVAFAGMVGERGLADPPQPQPSCHSPEKRYFILLEHAGIHLQAKYFFCEGACFTSVGILVKSYRMYFISS